MAYVADYGYQSQIEQGTNKAEVFIDQINRRVRVLNYRGNPGPLTVELKKLAANEKAGKIICYAYEQHVPDLLANNFVIEGEIEAFYQGQKACGCSLFLDDQRSKSQYEEKENNILQAIHNDTQQPNSSNRKRHGLQIKMASVSDIPALVSLYRQVFSSYPSPLLNEDYMRRVMGRDSVFVGAFDQDRPVSAASLELDRTNANAELTDCATFGDYRGRGILQALMNYLEEYGRKINLGVIYSLARAGSPGMNKSLHKLEYIYKGRFINNCHIGGRFEDMNLWVKVLS